MNSVNETIRVRSASPADLDALDAIEGAAFDAPRRASRRSLRRSLSSAHQLTLVAEDRGTVVGYAVLWRFRHTWRLYSIASDPVRQGSGIGRVLLAAAIGAARRGGAVALQLEARETPALAGWYARHGFEVIHRLPDYYASGDDAVRMRLTLQSTGASPGC
jgi:ribosomal protein S18 acetylase RimI-like enzyme